MKITDDDAAFILGKGGKTKASFPLRAKGLEFTAQHVCLGLKAPGQAMVKHILSVQEKIARVSGAEIASLLVCARLCCCSGMWLPGSGLASPETCIFSK